MQGSLDEVKQNQGSIFQIKSELQKFENDKGVLVMMLRLLAILACAIFTGAAIFISLVEHPARLSCGTEVALKEWVPSYKRGTVMQVSLAILGFVFAFIVWLVSSNIWWLIGGIVLISVIPFTLIVVMPTNKCLLSLAHNENTEEASRLLKKWGNLHMVRSALGLVALIIFLVNT
jgi:hypothetical protein